MTSASSQPYRSASKGDCTLGVKLASAGAGACIADAITYPLDMAKVRLQIRNNVGRTILPEPKELLKNGDYVNHSTVFPRSLGMYGTLRAICTHEGPRAMYAGMIAGLQRQLCFSSIRIGLYDEVKATYQHMIYKEPDSNPKVFVRVLAGLSTGAVSVTIAQPTEVVKIRMQAAGAKAGPAYDGVMHAYREIATKEGFRGLWRGYIPNVTRNSITSVSELVTYDLIKEQIIRHHLMTDNFPCHVVSGFTAGFVATVVSSPIDVVKTRYMSAPEGEYTGVIQCAKSMTKENGLKGFYKGFIPSFIRFASWNILTFVCYEQLKRLLSKSAWSLPMSDTLRQKYTPRPPA